MGSNEQNNLTNQTETEARTPAQTGSCQGGRLGGWTEEGEGINKKRTYVTCGHGPRSGDGGGRGAWGEHKKKYNHIFHLDFSHLLFDLKDNCMKQ